VVSTSSQQILPKAFYAGRARGRRLLVAFLIATAVSSTLLTVSGRLDVVALIGPHVERSEWAFTLTGARQLNSIGLTGDGVTVCVVDTGIDILHPDFSHLRLVAWKDLVNLRPDPYDDKGHGTAMAGLIIADGSIRGVAPKASIIAVKVLDQIGLGSPQNVADGIRFCVDPFGTGKGGADIISLSLGSNSVNFFDQTVYDAVTWATARGVFVIVAAGNNGGAPDNVDVATAGQVPLAISVGAVDSSGVRASFTSIGASLNRTDPNMKPEIAAPGVQLVSTAPGAHYVTVTGTSPATAIVAGVIALILQARPALRQGATVGNVLIVKTAMMLAASKAQGQVSPHDPWYGYGIISGPGMLANL
jgi:subtilisin family serine protease